MSDRTAISKCADESADYYIPGLISQAAVSCWDDADDKNEKMDISLGNTTFTVLRIIVETCGGLPDVYREVLKKINATLLIQEAQ